LEDSSLVDGDLSVMASSPESAVAVLFDSNFLMTAARLHFDLFQSVEQALDSPFDAKILSANLRELRGLASRSAPISQRQARVALKLAEFCRVIDQPSSERDPDEEILQFASTSKDTIVATNDAALRAKLRESGCPVLFLRRSGHLDLSGYHD